MGRTNPTFRDALRAVEERWSDYRRALRRRHQPRFDRLFTYARNHADAGGLLNHESPMLPVLFGVDLEQESRLDGHEDRLNDAEARLADLEAAVAELRARERERGTDPDRADDSEAGPPGTD